MGGLRLDTREFALQGGGRGPSIIPGNAADSLSSKLYATTPARFSMPPGPKLKESDAALLAQWIQMGAPWGSAQCTGYLEDTGEVLGLCSSQGADDPESGIQAWVRSPLDAFLLAALESEGPARAAGR